jgi:hypothetical protein
MSFHPFQIIKLEAFVILVRLQNLFEFVGSVSELEDTMFGRAIFGVHFLVFNIRTKLVTTKPYVMCLSLRSIQDATKNR